MIIDEGVQIGRGKNALLTFFEKRLSVPKIYLDAEWNGGSIDVLAINRDGVGEVHAALLFTRPRLEGGELDADQEYDMIDSLRGRFLSIPANFKYIAGMDSFSPNYGVERFRVFGDLEQNLFSPDGIGRVGLLAVKTGSEKDPEVTYMQKPERFRAAIARLADEYVEQHEADWEIRA